MTKQTKTPVDSLKIKLVHPSKRERGKLRETLFCKIMAFQDGLLGPGRIKSLGFLVRGPRRRLVGGVFGVILRGWLLVEFLWLDRKYRRHGVGSELMRRIEEKASRRGCRWASVATGEGQAPWFYPKFGYRCIGKKKYYRWWVGYYYAKRLSGRSVGRGRVPAALRKNGLALEAFSGSLKKMDRLIEPLGKKMASFIAQKTGPLGIKPLTIEARDADGALAGALTAVTFWNWFEIHQLWVEGRYRRQGLGTRLLDMAESEARRRRCVHATAVVYDIQEPFFCGHMGYRPFVHYRDFPKGHMRYCLSKDLKKRERMGG